MLRLYEFDLIDGYFPTVNYTTMIHTPEKPVIRYKRRSKWKGSKGLKCEHHCKLQKHWREWSLWNHSHFWVCNFKQVYLSLRILCINWTAPSNPVAFQKFPNSFMMGTSYAVFKEIIKLINLGVRIFGNCQILNDTVSRCEEHT